MTRKSAIVSSLSVVSLLMLGCGGSAPTNPPSSAGSEATQPESAGEKNDLPLGASKDPANMPAATQHTQTTPKPAATTPKSDAPKVEEPKAEPAPTKPEEPKIPAGMVLVPAGSTIDAMLITPISTKDASVGTKVRAEVSGPIRLEGGMKSPIKRWRLVGQISRIQEPQAKGDVPAELEISFTTLSKVNAADKRDFPIQGVLSEVGGNTKTRNTGIMIGGAVAGAILGKKVGGDTKDAVIGAAAGAGLGAGVVRAMPGKHIFLAKDDALTITLTADAILPVAEDKK